ncbi:mycofactocin biosynthesis glycosyltransferase MftF [Microbacterium sp. X-17]|uniref:mycofactocin biosynthesis glycosyltransferase MftF n=1 Tax=Microbacterium sp. X-17 TaxID=3144404 RepID=UPI0031F482D9
MRALPDGMVVRIGRHTRVRDDGTLLVGGAPTRVARLTPRAAALARDGRVVVRDAASRALAAHLLDTGLGDPVAASLPPVPLSELTVVVPVKDRVAPLDRLLASLPAGLGGTIVVDDGSADPAPIAAVVARHGARLIAFPENLGVSTARNTGLAEATTPFVAFIDSDVEVEPGSLEMLLRHFGDPLVALTAPRVLGREREHPGWITRYEDARSSLDLGNDAASVRPGSRVTWVSGTCLVARVADVSGFDATMRVGEDVDLVWRLIDAGRVVRYEPSAVVRHDHRTSARRWMARKFFYGTGALPLGERHPTEIAPVVLPPWAAGMLVVLAAQRRWSLPGAAAICAVVILRVARRLPHARHPRRTAARLVGDGALASLGQGSALLVRHWWPLALAASLVSRRARRAVAVAAVVDAAVEYARLRPRLDPVRFFAARRLDDLAYGAGVWWSALRGRSLRALMPRITRGHHD